MKKLFAFSFAMLMLLSCTTIAFAVEPTAEPDTIIEVSPDGTFEILVPKERIDADGTFTATFDMYVFSNAFTANSNSIALSLDSELVSDEPEEFPPEDSDYTDGTYNVRIEKSWISSVVASDTLDIGSSYRLNMYGVTAGNSYVLSFTCGIPDLRYTPYSIHVTGRISNITLN